MMMKFGLMKVMAYGEFTIIFGLSICSCLTVYVEGELCFDPCYVWWVMAYGEFTIIFGLSICSCQQFMWKGSFASTLVVYGVPSYDVDDGDEDEVEAARYMGGSNILSLYGELTRFVVGVRY